MILQELKQSLATLLKVDSNALELRDIKGGLSHKSYRCDVSGLTYYIKVYNKIENILNVVTYINQLTEYMRGRGVPASRVVSYSPEFPNIVVHEFIEGKPPSGELSQVAAIAGLYSKVAMIGRDHGKYLSKPDYLSQIQIIRDQLETSQVSDAEIDPVIHTGMLSLADRVLSALEAGMRDEKLLHIHVHDDFTEKNILMDGDQVKLLCDWDSCRLRYCNEHIASTASRFSTTRPLGGLLQQDKLDRFLGTLHPVLFENMAGIEAFAVLFPYWATLKHIRTYLFRSAVVHRDRPDLKQALLSWPLQHCLWMIDSRQQVSDWVCRALPSG